MSYFSLFVNSPGKIFESSVLGFVICCFAFLFFWVCRPGKPTSPSIDFSKPGEYILVSLNELFLDEDLRSASALSLNLLSRLLETHKNRVVLLISNTTHDNSSIFKAVDDGLLGLLSRRDVLHDILLLCRCEANRIHVIRHIQLRFCLDASSRVLSQLEKSYSKMFP